MVGSPLPVCTAVEDNVSGTYMYTHSQSRTQHDCCLVVAGLESDLGIWSATVAHFDMIVLLHSFVGDGASVKHSNTLRSA
jgi:hypothetical protein